jgi:hypothetical protein
MSKIDDIRSLGVPGIGRQLNPRGSGGKRPAAISTAAIEQPTKLSPLKCPVCEARRIAHRLRAAKSRAKKEAKANE